MTEDKEWKDSKLLSVEDGFDLVIPTRYNIDTSNLYLNVGISTSVSYRFTSAIRKNHFAMGTYGSANMTCRRLYEILVDAFNYGEDFIAKYFEVLFKQRFDAKIRKILKRVQRELLAEQKEIDAALAVARITSAGRLDKRSRGSKKLSQFKVWKSDKLRAEMAAISAEIKKDIVHCLATGKLPTAFFFTSPDTLVKRAKLGLDSQHAFYASGQLIEHLVVYYKVVFDV